MKVYMYSKEEALKNNYKNDFDLGIHFTILCFSLAILLVVSIFIIPSNTDKDFFERLVALLPWVVVGVFYVKYFKYIMKQNKLTIWSEQTAFIKENDTLWAVKLTYIQFNQYTYNRRYIVCG